MKHYDIAVDFDDTLAEYHRPYDPWKVGKPLPGAIEWLLYHVRDCKKDIVIYSCRANKEHGVAAIRGWLNKYLPSWGTKVDIWCSTGKPLAKRYIDDKAEEFTQWPDTY
mgnify:CR=1 FL=1